MEHTNPPNPNSNTLLRLFWNEPRKSDMLIRFDSGDVPGHQLILAQASRVWMECFFGDELIMTGKDPVVLDMHRHDPFFMKMVYGIFPEDGEEVEVEKIIDAIGLAHEYETMSIERYLVQYVHVMRIGEGSKFARIWPYWKNIALCDIYENSLFDALRFAIDRKEKIPQEEQRYLVASGYAKLQCGSLYAIDILVEHWKSGKESDQQWALEHLNQLLSIHGHILCKVQVNGLLRKIAKEKQDKFFSKLKDILNDYTRMRTLFSSDSRIY